MRLVTDFLSRFGQNFQTGSVSPEDSDLIIPPVVVPQFKTPRPNRFFDSATALGLNYSDSFSLSHYSSRTNQAAADVTMLLIASGMWELNIFLEVRIGFAMAAGNYGSLALMSPSGARTTLIPYSGDGTAKTIRQDYVRHINLLQFPSLNVVQGDFYTFIMAFPSTVGAGNQVEVFLCMVANRFL